MLEAIKLAVHFTQRRLPTEKAPKNYRIDLQC